jgi:peptide/nickel transport system ATP-binding protein
MTLAIPPSSDEPFVGLAGTPLADESEEKDIGRRRPRFWRRFTRQHWAMAGVAFLAVMITAAIFAPLIAPYNPNTEQLTAINASPSAAHWLGTDDLGRDILSRIIWGGRISFRATFEIVLIGLIFSLPLGLIAGFFRGAVDTTIMRFMDALFSFPPLILALTVAALLGASIDDTALAIGIVFVPSFVRLLRGQVIAVREEDYIESARSLGAKSSRLIGRHIAPNVASPVIIQVALALGYALLAEAGLSFLGIGEQPPTPSWGGMLNEAFNFIYTDSWALIFPGLAIMLTVLSFNLVADGLRDALGRERPKTRRFRLRKKEKATTDEAVTPRAQVSPGEPATSGASTTTDPSVMISAAFASASTDGAAAAAGDSSVEPLLAVSGLRIEFLTDARWLAVVEDVNFAVAPGRTLGIVGESGSGKTVSALAIMGLLPQGVSRVTGSVDFEHRRLTSISASELQQIRGNQMSMIFQEPMTSLNPAFTVGNQVAEQIRVHRKISRSKAWKQAVEMLDRVEIPQAASRAKDYPHAFSGGMRQRVMIAMALSCSPELLIADEPTTALDVTTQAQIIELLHSLQREEGMAMIFVTHDLGVIADVADDVVVMYASQIVEHAPAKELFKRPRHPYTEGLLASIPQRTPAGEPLHFIPGMVPRPDQFSEGCHFSPRCQYAEEQCSVAPIELRGPSQSPADHLGTPTTSPEALTRCLRQDELELVGAGSEAAARSPGLCPGPTELAPSEPLLQTAALSKQFELRSGIFRRVHGSVKAVDAVDLRVMAGTTLGLVGESGSGKSTLARLVLRLMEPTSGTVTLDGSDITALRGPSLRRNRQKMQMVFQDPFSSLDPLQTVSEIVGEPLRIHTDLKAAERERRVVELLRQVGLRRHILDRQPHEFSGGQRQRIAIARALALHPQLLVCDEPVSALDMSTQSQVINLFSELQDRLGLAYLFIAHDLSVVRHLSDRIAVMYLGKIVEEGLAEEVYLRPTHPYTLALLSAIPVPDPEVQRKRRRIVLKGEVKVDETAMRGCRFRSRCPFAMEICSSVDPEPYRTRAGTTVRCHLHTSGPNLAGETVARLGG